MDNIGILFAGPEDHNLETTFNNIDKNYIIRNINYAEEYYNHIIEPISKKFHIFIFVTCSTEEKNNWQSKWKNLFDNKKNPNIKLFCIETINTLPDNIRFTQTNNFHHGNRFNESYHNQYGKLNNSFNVMKKYEDKERIQMQYLIKGRSDFIYRDLFNVNWLLNLPKNTICISSTEWHTPDRWMERTNQTQKNEKIGLIYPGGFTDQMIFGYRCDMKYIFDIVSCDEKSLPNKIHPEHILYQNLIITHKKKILTCEFQFKKPWIPSFATTNNSEGSTVNDPWVKIKSKLVWDGNRLS